MLFSHDAVHMISVFNYRVIKADFKRIPIFRTIAVTWYETHYEKTCLWGF